MSAVMDADIKRWIARRKSALVLQVIWGKTTTAAASRQFDLTPTEIERWVEEGKRGMEHTRRSKSQDVRKQQERQLKDLQEAHDEAMLSIHARKKSGIPAGEGRELLLSVQQDTSNDGAPVPIISRASGSVRGVGRRTTRRPKARPRAKPSCLSQSRR
jgi:hypothetical protein